MRTNHPPQVSTCPASLHRTARAYRAGCICPIARYRFLDYERRKRTIPRPQRGRTMAWRIYEDYRDVHERRMKIVGLSRQGFTQFEIATRLGCSPRTVQRHLTAYRKEREERRARARVA